MQTSASITTHPIHPMLLNFPIILSAIGVCAYAISRWLGGQMVHVHGVGEEGREQA